MTYTAEAYFKHDHSDKPIIVGTPEQMDAVIDALLAEPFDNSVAALYIRERPLNTAGVPDHELLIAVNGIDQVGALCYRGEVTSTAKGAASKYDDVVYYYMGSDRPFPRDSDLPLDTIRQAAREFLATGGERPSNLQWQDLSTP